MSCRTISNEEFANTIPVKPPTVNKKIKPRAQSKGVSHLSCFDPDSVANQLNTLIPVGTAITIVAAVK